MPRSGGGRSGGGRAPSRAPARPTAAPVKPAPQQTRPATTAAHPPATANAQKSQQQASGGPGLFGQMASTAAGVAVGSSIGHAIGGLFGGGSPAAEQEGGAVASQGNESMQQSNTWGAANCDVDARNFTKCMDEHNGNMQICGWYMQQLKACQQAASQY